MRGPETQVSPLKGIRRALHSIEGSGNPRGLPILAAGAELLDYRERFPILAETTYLINHSLGAMPAAAEERLLEYARDWNDARRARLGGGLVGDAADGRRPDRAG